MSLCNVCGNQIVVGCGPVCLVCQHTGRGEKHAATELQATLKQVVAERQAGALALALDAVYGALAPVPTPLEEFELAQARIGSRIMDQTHNRERPDLEANAQEERERNECQVCIGTGMVDGQKCPECWSED